MKNKKYKLIIIIKRNLHAFSKTRQQRHLIRSKKQDRLAEESKTAHWLYKGDKLSEAQAKHQCNGHGTRGDMLAALEVVQLRRSC